MPIRYFRLDKYRYIYLDIHERRFGNIITIAHTNKVTHPFFLDLEKPILIEDEYNAFHYEYLYDNVRRSEDYGDDNHIYMFYRDMYEFLCFICTENIVPYLFDEKIIFLFTKEDREGYPIDFKRNTV